MEPLVDVKALSEGGSANISANSAAFPGLFAPLAARARFYSGAMLSIALLAPLARVAPRRLAWGFLVVCGLLVAALPANAEDALAAGLVDQVRSLALDKAAAPAAARVEVVVGQLDPRLHLAPCERIEPYLPANVRLWGKSRIGLRCTQGRTAWNVYLPIVVKVWGRALVVPAGAAAGSVLAGADLEEAEVDLAEEFTAPFFDRKLVVGRTLAQALRPGQAVRQAHIKSRQWFAAGETVKVVAVGEGFALEGVGQALTNGIEGQPAKVRTESGRIVTGVPTADRRLELTL
jgi:flagella basal body P-ring formation protein FlgA